MFSQNVLTMAICGHRDTGVTVMMVITGSPGYGFVQPGLVFCGRPVTGVLKTGTIAGMAATGDLMSAFTVA